MPAGPAGLDAETPPADAEVPATPGSNDDDGASTGGARLDRLTPPGEGTEPPESPAAAGKAADSDRAGETESPSGETGAGSGVESLDPLANDVGSDENDMGAAEVPVDPPEKEGKETGDNGPEPDPSTVDEPNPRSAPPSGTFRPPT